MRQVELAVEIDCHRQTLQSVRVAEVGRYASMKRTRTFLAVVALAISSTNVCALDFSDDPLKIEAIEPARAVVETIRINNWLNANQERMNEVQVKRVREHLHALIDARVACE